MNCELERGPRSRIAGNRSDPSYRAPTPRQGRDWQQARDQYPWTLLDPWKWVEAYAVAGQNCLQLTSIILTGAKL